MAKTLKQIKDEEMEAKSKSREFIAKRKLAEDISDMSNKIDKLTPEQIKAYKKGLPEAERLADKAQKEAESAAGIPDDASPGYFEKRRKEVPYKKGGSVSSASKRADGCAVKGKTRGKMV